MSCEQVARRMGMSVAGVSAIERRALRKLRKNGAAREMFQELTRRERDEAVTDSALSLRFAKSKKEF